MLIREPEEIPLNDDEDLVEPTVSGFFALGYGTVKVTCVNGEVLTLTIKEGMGTPLIVKRFWKTGTTVKVYTYKWKDEVK